MARFELMNATIKKIERGTNAGKEYLAASLINTLAPWDSARSFTEFDERKIDIIKQYIPASKGGTGAEDVKMPDTFRFLNGHYVTWYPPKECVPFNRVYVTDLVTTLRNGTKIQHKAGDIITDQNGNPRLYDSCVVFCQYYNDPDFKEVQYLRGNTPTEKGQAYFSTFCVSINNNAQTPPTSTTDDDDLAGEVASAEVPAGKKLAGYDANMNPIYVDA